MIDLTKFTQETTVIMPIVDFWGKFNGRKVELGVENGWYQVKLGNTAIVEKKASPLQILKALRDKPTLKVYALGLEGIPVNFSNFRSRGYDESIPVNFLDLDIFKIANIVKWEDGRFYYANENVRLQKNLITEVHEAFDGKRILSDVRGVTPEIRYYLVLLNLQRSASSALQELKHFKLGPMEVRRRVEGFKYSMEDRVRDAITRAGGEFISCSAKGQYILVEWRVGGQTLKSHIRDDLRIISAGFCLSGDDKEHSLNSIVNLAKMFQERNPLYITRE